MGFIPEMQEWFNICKSINVLHHINKMETANHVIISTDAKKHLTNSTSTYNKTLSKVNIEGIHFNTIKVTNHIQGWKANSFSSNIRNKTRLFTISLLFNIVLEVLARVVRKENEIRGIKTGKEEVKLSLFVNDMILYTEKS